jgi:predicted acetyltransferase
MEQHVDQFLELVQMKSEIVKLVRPTVSLQESFLEALVEFQEEKIAWLMDLKVDVLRRDFAKYVEAQGNKRTLWTKDTPVDETVLWADLKGIFVGQISIRHKLNADLQIMGGHIGYETRPTYRQHGIASSMLRQSLPIARSLGIQKALLTCNDDNGPSIKVIEKNGGVLEETKPQFEGGPLKRYYWIQT